jgi:hypothetical protein
LAVNKLLVKKKTGRRLGREPRGSGPRDDSRAPAGRVRGGRSGSVEIVIKGARFTEADAEAHVHGICFKTGPPERVGVELEWLVRDRRDPALPVQA